MDMLDSWMMWDGSFGVAGLLREAACRIGWGIAAFVAAHAAHRVGLALLRRPYWRGEHPIAFVISVLIAAVFANRIAAFFC